MSDIQDLIHKTSIDCIKQGERQATDRIIKMLEDKVAVLEKIEVGHGYGSELNSIRTKAIGSIINLIKGEK